MDLGICFPQSLSVYFKKDSSKNSRSHPSCMAPPSASVFRCQYVQLLEEAKEEKFDERRVNLLKAQVLQLERQVWKSWNVHHAMHEMILLLIIFKFKPDAEHTSDT